MNLKGYMEIRNKNLVNKSALSPFEARNIGVNTKEKGWMERYADVEINKSTLTKIINKTLKSDTVDERCKGQLEKILSGEVVCVDSNYDINKYLYLMENEFGLVKIGISKNPRKRADSISNSSGVPTKVIAFWTVYDLAANVESRLHEKFKNSRRAGEWFSKESVTTETIESAIYCNFIRVS